MQNLNGAVGQSRQLFCDVPVNLDLDEVVKIHHIIS